ncbi:MAG: flagellar protein FliS [Lachnospiraceae bacterium]|nr:flagellar protein FliS [Lachnospiraceae bacterium]
MDQELKRTFTRRISQSNKTELVVVIFDIYFAHTECAVKQKAVGDRRGYKESLRLAVDVQNELIRALDMKYEISENLKAIYQYCKRLVYRALSEDNIDYLKESDRLMGKLRESFVEVAKTDNSAKMMQNTQNVYAGITYGNGTLNENYDYSASRGFFA